MMLLVLLVVINLQLTFGVLIHHTLTFNTSNIREAVPLLPDASPSIQLSYRTELYRPSCPVYVHFFSRENRYSHEQDNIISFTQTYPMLGVNRYYVPLTPFFNMECGSRRGRTHCSGRRAFTHETAKFWFVSLQHKCDRNRRFIRSYSISLELSVETEVPGRCVGIEENIKVNQILHGLFFNKDVTTYPAYFPNVFGFTEIPDRMLMRQIDVAIVSIKCYQHLETLLYLSMYPMCRVHDLPDTISNSTDKRVDSNNTTSKDTTPKISFLAPCQNMCREMLSACPDGIFKANECDNYPSIDCFYRSVQCSDPPLVSNASVYMRTSEEVSYTCDNGTSLKGPTSTIYCTPAGSWSQVKFSCEVTPEVKVQAPYVLIAIYATVFFILLLISSVLFHYRKVLIFLMEVNLFRGPSRLSDMITQGANKPKLFISFSSLDYDEVALLKSNLTRHLKECQIITYEDDFIIGQRIVNCIREAISQCHAVIIHLTHNYVESEWCEYEFNEAHQRWLTDKGFRLVIISNCDVSKLEHTSEHLQLYLKSHIYLQNGEKYFWSRLRKALLT